MNIIIIFICILSAACSSTDVPVWHSPCQQSIKCASHHHHHQGRDQGFFVCVSSLANPLFWMHIPILASPTVGEQDCAADNCCPRTHNDHKQDDQMDLSAFAWFARFVKTFSIQVATFLASLVLIKLVKLMFPSRKALKAYKFPFYQIFWISSSTFWGSVLPGCCWWGKINSDQSFKKGFPRIPN